MVVSCQISKENECDDMLKSVLQDIVHINRIILII